jgi:hypothetical protein
VQHRHNFIYRKGLSKLGWSPNGNVSCRRAEMLPVYSSFSFSSCKERLCIAYRDGQSDRKDDLLKMRVVVLKRKIAVALVVSVVVFVVGVVLDDKINEMCVFV